jgi:hypothetical protein
MGISSGGKKHNGGEGRPRRSKRALPPHPEKSKPHFRPIENPFPEKKSFRLGVFEIIEEKDDYLICRGYDPNEKHPFAHITPSAYRTIEVGKPPHLQRTAWEDPDQAFEIGGVTYTYEYSDDEFGVRTQTGNDGSSEEQRIEIPYFEGDYIVAVELQQNGAVDGFDLDNEDGARLSWMDLNVSGRRWSVTETLRVGTFVAQGDDFITVTPAGGTSPADDIEVAKPGQLRRTPWDGETRDGITYTYTSEYQRTGNDGSADEEQEIIPRYVAGDEIIFRPINGEDLQGALDDVNYIDTNIDGRAWAKISS